MIHKYHWFNGAVHNSLDLVLIKDPIDVFARFLFHIPSKSVPVLGWWDTFVYDNAHRSVQFTQRDKNTCKSYLLVWGRRYVNLPSYLWDYVFKFSEGYIPYWNKVSISITGKSCFLWNNVLPTLEPLTKYCRAWLQENIVNIMEISIMGYTNDPFLRSNTRFLIDILEKCIKLMCYYNCIWWETVILHVMN